MNIKKVDDKPMVIHTKEKPKIHVKAEPEAKIKGRNILVVEKGPKIAGVVRKDRKTIRKPETEKKKQTAKEEVRKTMQKENSIYAKYQKSMQDKEKAIGKKNSTIHSVTSVGTMAALDQMEGGQEVHEAVMAARTISAPAVSAADAGKRLYQYTCLLRMAECRSKHYV